MTASIPEDSPADGATARPMMTGMRTSRLAGCPLLLTTLLAGQAAPELPLVREAVERMVAELRLRAAGLAVVRADAELHRSLHGSLRADMVLPIASASKWLAVATVLTLVDEGLLDLDAPVGRYVQEFDRADHGSLTLRHCLSCSGGVAPRLGERMRGWDMARFAAAAAAAPLRGTPGTVFRYGGATFQIAAVAAERVSGRSWHELFAARIAAPVGMPDTRFGALQPIGGEPGTTALPWVAGGAVSTLADYARFLRLLVAGGTANGKRVLREESIALMWRDQVPPSVEVRAPGLDLGEARYGLGTWLIALDGGAIRATDPGAFGFTPWVDLDRGIGGVFAVRDRAGRVLDGLAGVQDAVRAATAPPRVAGFAATVTLPRGGRDRRYHLHVPPHVPGGPGMPLLLVLHGGGGHGEQVRDSTGLAELGVAAGFAVAFPDGTGPLRSRLLTWNSGGIPVYAADRSIDDVGLLRAVVADVAGRVPIDPARIFAAGHSNGGMMCHRLAREAADLFAGIAVVAGAMNFTSVEAQQPIAVLIVHGTADEHVRYDGGAPRAAMGRAGERVDASVRQAIDHYLVRNGVLDDPVTEIQGKARIDTWARGRQGRPAVAPVRVVTLEGGGHAWPGAKRTRLPGGEPFPFDASAAILDFFASLQPAPRAGTGLR